MRKAWRMGKVHAEAAEAVEEEEKEAESPSSSSSSPSPSSSLSQPLPGFDKLETFQSRSQIRRPATFGPI